jgi:hypothetical protein
MFIKRGSTWFLRGVIVFMGLVALAVCIFALPSIAKGAIAEYPIIAPGWLYLFIGGLYLSTIPFFVALLQGMKLLHYIDTNISFSPVSLKALRIIKFCGIAISICYAAGIPYLFRVADLDDAPGLILLSVAFACVPLIVATFAMVLQKLFQSALEIKSENDLTV